MKNINLLLIFGILLISCEAKNTENCHKVITIINNSNKILYISESYNYPNIDDYKNLASPLISGSPKIEPNETRAYVPVRDCIEYTYANQIPSGIMMFYVFDGEILETQGWDYIKTNDLVLKRYDLTLENLENLNWTITYDGN